MPETTTLATAADALLRTLVPLARQRFNAGPAAAIKATPFEPRDPASLPRRDALDPAGLAADPIGTACRAELRRVGHAIHAAAGADAFTDALVDIAEMDPAFAGWRASVLESAWAGIGGTP